MRNILIGSLLFVTSATACNPSGIEKNKTEKKSIDVDEVVTDKTNIDDEKDILDELKLDNGIRINWFAHGEGDQVKYGDVISIDYKAFLTDKTVIDGNHLLKKASVPFMVGFNMQTKGWDIALAKLRVGDFVEIFIPSDLARGEKGIEGLIPPNADNILKIRILSRMKPTREVDGNKVWVFEENSTNKEEFGEGKQIEFHCMVSTSSKPLYVNTYQTNNPFQLRLDDSGAVPGLKKALINAKKSDRMFVYVPASEAYGSKGYLDVVKPNEDLFYNILVMNVTKQ